MTNKIDKTIGLLRKLQNLFPRTVLTTIYKAFVRPFFDYGDILCGQVFNLSFQWKLESIQYGAAFSGITSTIWDTSWEKIYQEPGLQSGLSRWWYVKLASFCKIFKNKSSFYLFNLILEKHLLILREMLIVFPWLKFDFQKYFLPIFNH